MFDEIPSLFDLWPVLLMGAAMLLAAARAF
jgi:hypothetical protein